MNKKKVLVVIGGQSTEHSVSRVSGSSVCRELNKDKYEMTICGIDLEGQWYILDKEIKDYSKENWLDNASKVIDIFGFINF